MNCEKLLNSSRWCVILPRHCLYFLLIFTIVLFFFYTNLKETAPDGNPKLLKPHPLTKLFFPHRSPSVASENMSSSIAANTTCKVFPVSQPTKETLLVQTTPPKLAPYVSPGPYVVEYPHEYHFVINEPQKCERSKPFVVILVHVAPYNRPHRDIIRGTWGNESLVLGKVVKLFFMLGLPTGEGAKQLQQQVLQESKEHQDLIQGDFVDCYKNLTIKTMVLLEWLNLYCSSAYYAMKIDSDTFLNVPNLINMLLKAPTTNYLTGQVAYEAGVMRDRQSKWYLPMNMYPQSSYPPYVLGVGYILSLDLPKKLTEASRYVKALYIEDVYLGLCMQHLGIHPTNPPEEGRFSVFPLNYNRCTYSKIIVTTISPHVNRMQLWLDFKSPRPYC